MKNIKKIILFSFFLSTISVLSACSTVHGIGKDVSKTGQVIQRAAN